MLRHPLNAVFLVALAVVFTVGLTFATLELPYLIDDALINTVPTPDIDSHANEFSAIKTELFLAHFHVRGIGYTCFGLLVALIVAGFVTPKTGLATVGAIGFMLPVFAQFAGVMFFLAGLGLLNVVWLPILDISFEIQRLGLVIRAPYDFIRWLMSLAGLPAFWPCVVFFVSSGILLFFFGTLAWLSARARGAEVASSWVYRISRHPQYLGWILWSYGVYLLLLRGLYPKRSWGIDPSLSWLLATMIIIGVALLEELSMKQRHGKRYEKYRASAPFLLPLPSFVNRLMALPLRIIFRKDQPQRKREVVYVVGFYTVVLMIASSLLYGGGLTRLVESAMPGDQQSVSMTQLATKLSEEQDRRQRHRLADDLASYGNRSTSYFTALLHDPKETVRQISADRLARLADPSTQLALVEALRDTSPDVRRSALTALSRIGSTESSTAIHLLLEDPEESVRIRAVRTLAELGSETAYHSALKLLQSEHVWLRIAGVESLAKLGETRAIPALAALLADSSSHVRQEVVVALLMIGSADACGALQSATQDDDREVRIYANQALRLLARKE